MSDAAWFLPAGSTAPVSWTLVREDLVAVLDAALPRSVALLGSRIPEALTRELDANTQVRVVSPAHAELVLVAGTGAEAAAALGELRARGARAPWVHGMRVPGFRSVPAAVDGWYEHSLDEPAGVFDEQLLLSISPRSVDGFTVARFETYTDLPELEFRLSDVIAPHCEVHYRPGPLLAGQRRPIDIELLPYRIPRGGAVGELEAVDGEVVVASMRLALFAGKRVPWVVSGSVDGPIRGAELGQLVARLQARRLPLLVAALRIGRRELQEARGS